LIRVNGQLRYITNLDVRLERSYTFICYKLKVIVIHPLHTPGLTNGMTKISKKRNLKYNISPWKSM